MKTKNPCLFGSRVQHVLLPDVSGKVVEVKNTPVGTVVDFVSDDGRRFSYPSDQLEFSN